MSATFQVHSHGFSATKRQLLQLADPDFQQELLDSVGALVKSQTRQRIQEDKTSPDGKAWAEWSEIHSRTRNSGKSLLQSEKRIEEIDPMFLDFCLNNSQFLNTTLA